MMMIGQLKTGLFQLSMSLARAQTQTAQSGVKRSNHEATAVPTPDVYKTEYFLLLFHLFACAGVWW